MKVYVCIKKFKQSDMREVLGVFSTNKKAQQFAKEFPTFSMDDPDSFDVIVKQMQIDKTSWGDYLNE
jgi:hypothetical protein